MAEIMWCLEHGRNILMYEEKDGNFHVIWNDEGSICVGPFFTSAPPELEEDWYVRPEPNDEEIAEMDEKAEELLFDLGLVEK